jgi:hypothetical protein
LVIKPLPPELIGKLEVAISHRNREWAIAVINQALKRETQRKPVTNETALVELFSVREAGALESAGLLYLGDLRRTDLNELRNCRGIGPFLFEKVKAVLSEQ